MNEAKHRAILQKLSAETLMDMVVDLSAIIDSGKSVTGRPTCDCAIVDDLKRKLMRTGEAQTAGRIAGKLQALEEAAQLMEITPQWVFTPDELAAQIRALAESI